jgi:D-alanyl-D-alanine carboxypeptidase
MTRTPSSVRTTTDWLRRLLLVGLVVVTAVITVTFGYRSQSSSSALAESASKHSSPAPPLRSSSAPAPNAYRSQHRAAVGEADGVVPDGVTVFDDAIPAVANLDPDLRKALRHAAAGAALEDITFYVNSGWRSPEYQNQLLREAVSKYGSEGAAARWVATAATSPHVSGDAVDIGHSDATAWLSKQGAEYGLCQIYRNEPWHYELRPRAVAHGCPRMYANPTQDPRMQR